MKEKERTFLSCCSNEREKKEEEVSFQSFLRRSREFRRSEFIEPRTKVHLLYEGYKRDFAKDPSEEFEKSKVSGLRSVHGTS